jgi:hypothetical protein
MHTNVWTLIAYIATCTTYLDEIGTGPGFGVDGGSVGELRVGILEVPRKEYSSAPSVQRELLVPLGGDLAEQVKVTWKSQRGYIITMMMVLMDASDIGEMCLDVMS